MIDPLITILADSNLDKYESLPDLSPYGFGSTGGGARAHIK
jgi:hypothetical protein